MSTSKQTKPLKGDSPRRAQTKPLHSKPSQFHSTQIASASLCSTHGAVFPPTIVSAGNDEPYRKPASLTLKMPVALIMQMAPTDGPSETPTDANTEPILRPRRQSRNLNESVSSEDISADQLLDSTIDDDTILCPDPVAQISQFTNPFCKIPVLESSRISGFSDPVPRVHKTLVPSSACKVPQKKSLAFNSDSEDDESTGSDETTIMGRQGFPGHRDTLALIKFRNRRSPSIPEAVFQALVSIISFDDYKALRLTCRDWQLSLPPPFLPITFNIPSEILQQVYQYLTPLDFDAARHICSAWYIASLDPSLEALMLRRAGLVNAAEEDQMYRIRRSKTRTRVTQFRRSIDHDSNRMHDFNDTGLDESISEEWLLSKRLATEAKLLPHWRGSFQSVPSTSYELRKRMTVMEEIDFGAVLAMKDDPQPGEPASKTFTVSACGRFVLVNTGCEIHLYSLATSIKAITSIPCRRKVLCVSMDTSSSRYTVAVLLRERMGMCWDLAFGVAEPASMSSAETLLLGMHTDIYSSDLSQSESRPSRVTLPYRRAEYTSIPPRSIDLVHTNATIEVAPYNECQRLPSSPLIDLITEDTTGFTEPQEYETSRWPIEAGLIAIYEHLGSPDDAPRSVAICPQRKCVAFGCRMGIELHWQDALTGADLNRWFPLAAPSDHLYFLPQRSGFDTSKKKLRLISSAGGPSSPSLSRRGSVPSSWTQHVRRSSPPFIPDSLPRQQSMTRLFFGSLPFPSAATSLMPNLWSTHDTPSDASRGQEERHGVLRTVDSEHYQAVPLSDGIHVMFTDPASGLLCMGSDAPIGSPTKLIRKFALVPPGHVPRSKGLMPIRYQAGKDLRWGVRIVAAYGDGSFVLFNIPPDVFHGVKPDKCLPKIWDEQAGVLAQSDLLMDAVMEQHQPVEVHPNALTTPETGNIAARQQHDDLNPTTIPFHGVRIGRVQEGTSIEDLAVRTESGGLRIWVFQSNGIATCWDIYAPRDHQILRRRVAQNGLIEESTEDARPVSSKGKGKANKEDKTAHVRFGIFDGSSDEACSTRIERSVPESPRQPGARSSAVGFAPSQKFCCDPLISGLAYKKTTFERMAAPQSGISGESTGRTCGSDVSGASTSTTDPGLDSRTASNPNPRAWEAKATTSQITQNLNERVRGMRGARRSSFGWRFWQIGRRRSCSILMRL